MKKAFPTRQRIVVKHSLDGKPSGESHVTQFIYVRDGKHVIRWGKGFKEIREEGGKKVVDYPAVTVQGSGSLENLIKDFLATRGTS